MATSRPAARWAVPATVAAAVVGGSLVVPTVASAAPDLPPTTAAELLEDLAAAEPQDHSGTVEQITDLDLPELPEGQGASGELSTLLGGTTTFRVWVDGPERSRIAVIRDLAETDVIRDGQDVWLWRSSTGTATHATLPPAPAGEDGAHPPVPLEAATPAEAAAGVLQALDPTTAVALGEATTVAGRDAHQLVLQPRDEETLVGEVRLAVDAETSFPLQVQVFAEGAEEPSLETGYTDITYATPDADVFAFAPPPGAPVAELPLPSGEHSHQGLPDGQDLPGHASGPSALSGPSPSALPVLVGEGWSAVLVLPAGAGGPSGLGVAEPQEAPSGPSEDELEDPFGGSHAQRHDDGGIGQALAAASRPVSGAYGSGRLLSTTLVSVLTLDDGRRLVGAVRPEVLERAALHPAAAALAGPTTGR
jgi:outer membrane lipoprotein-sorting protein